MKPIPNDLKQRARAAWTTVWQVDLTARSWWIAGPVKLLRVLAATGRDLAGGELTLRAMSLVYTTLLSLVPLLAFSFSVLKAFGSEDLIQPLLFNYLEPLGQKGAEVAERIIGFVENIKVGVLGTVGLGLLIYTVISLLYKVEQSFNFIWQIKKARRLGERFTDYLSVVLIGPVLVVTALGLTASMMSHSVVQSMLGVPVLGTVVESTGKLVPYSMVIAAFIFSYAFMPNTRVRLTAALMGGLVAGGLWQTSGWGFSAFVVGSTKYTAIYSSFAILILFMIWMFVSWLILLAGASIAFYWQHPENIGLGRAELSLSGRMRERIALMIMLRVARHYYHDRPPWTAEDLAQELSLPKASIETMLDLLHRAGLVVAVGEEGIGYVPGWDIERIRVTQVLDAVRTDGEGKQLTPMRLPADPVIDELEEMIGQAVGGALEDRSLRSLVLSSVAEPESVPETPEGPKAVVANATD